MCGYWTMHSPSAGDHEYAGVSEGEPSSSPSAGEEEYGGMDGSLLRG